MTKTTKKTEVKKSTPKTKIQKTANAKVVS